MKATLRSVAGLFATGVTVVSAVDPVGGAPHGMTANGFMSVSLEPPLVAVSVAHRARLHGMLEGAAGYGVTILGADLEAEARRFAGMPVSTEPIGFDYHEGVPVLPGGLAWLVTTIVDRHVAGDHTLFIGQVLDMDLVRPGAPPLGFFRSQFSSIAPMTEQAPMTLDAWSGGGGLWG